MVEFTKMDAWNYCYLLNSKREFDPHEVFLAQKK